MAIIKKTDWFVVAIVVVSSVIFTFKCKITYPIKWVGHAEEAAYAEIAENLIQGKGISNDFIGFAYFYSPLKYPEITHADAHYPPLYPFLIVPFFLILGKNAFAAKLPSLLVSSFLLPVFLYWLVRRLSKSRITGFAAALNTLIFPGIFSHSLRPDDDVLFPFMFLASCLFIIKAMDKPRYFYWTGIFIGLAYYVKGSALVLIPVFFLSCLILGESKRKGVEFRKVTSYQKKLNTFKHRKMWTCFLIIFLVMLPWFIRNTIHFGNPFFSTENYAAGYIGYQDWETGTYSLYWDKERPTLFTKLTQDPEKTWKKTTEFYKKYLWWSFIETGGDWKELSSDKLYIYYTGIPAIFGLLLFFACNVYLLFLRLFVKFISKLPTTYKVIVKKIYYVVKKYLLYWYNLDYYVLCLSGITLLTFLSVCWSPITRLAFPVVLITMAIGWTTYFLFIKQVFSWTKYSRIIASCIVGLLMIPLLYKSGEKVYHDYKHAGWPYREGGQAWMEAGRWLKENAPDSVTMTRNPWELHFYSEEKAVQIPLASLERIIKVAQYYKVTHLIPEKRRPSLKPWLSGEVPGLKLVYDSGLKIYEIQHELLPSE